MMCREDTVYIRMYTYVYIHMYTYVYIHMYTYVYIHMYMYIYIHMYMYVYRHMYMYVYTHMYMYVYIHMYMYIYTHMYMYVYILRLRNLRFKPLPRHPVVEVSFSLTSSSCCSYQHYATEGVKCTAETTNKHTYTYVCIHIHTV